MSATLLNRLRYHLERAAATDADEDWLRIHACLDALEPAALRSARLARALPLLRRRVLPADLVALCGELAAATRRPAEPASAPTAEGRVRTLLAGRALLLLGGVPRPDAAERLRASFDLAALHWPLTSEVKPTLTAIEPWIARSDVAAVVLLIRWIRHALNDVDALCARHEKPLVRVTGGYNPTSVAHALLEQCAARLEPPHKRRDPG
jgi:hypothetical protein